MYTETLSHLSFLSLGKSEHFWFTLKIELIFLPNVRVALMICKLEVSKYLEFSTVNMRRECMNSLVDVNIFFHREYFGSGVCVRLKRKEINRKERTLFSSEDNLIRQRP